MLFSIFSSEKRRSFSLEKKRRFVWRPMGRRRTKATARKYDVQGNMIRSWNKQMMVLNKEEDLQQNKKKEKGKWEKENSFGRNGI